MYNVKYKVYADRESEGGDITIQCSSRPNLAQCNNSCSTRRGDAVELVSPNFWDQWHPTMLKLDSAKNTLVQEKGTGTCVGMYVWASHGSKQTQIVAAALEWRPVVYCSTNDF